MSGDREELFKRAVARERAAREQAEMLLERKSLELYERNVLLQMEVRERRRAEEVLQEQARQLQESNEELERFAYVASHDLQTPLRGIINFSELLARRVKPQGDAKALEYLDFIDSAAKRLHEVIHDLLTYSRAGRREHKPAPFDARKLLDELCQTLRPAIEARSGQIVYAALPEIYGDRAQLSHVFQNLLTNGLKFQPAGKSPRIEVSAQAEGGGWHWVVQDNGIGIDPKNVPRLFTLFHRLHTDDEYEGTGVGLAICKRIVERHGGRIWVESQPGAGAAFHFTLPEAVVGSG